MCGGCNDEKISLLFQAHIQDVDNCGCPKHLRFDCPDLLHQMSAINDNYPPGVTTQTLTDRQLSGETRRSSSK